MLFRSKLNRRFHIYGGENGDTKTDEEKRLAEDKAAKDKAAKDNAAKDKEAKDKEAKDKVVTEKKRPENKKKEETAIRDVVEKEEKIEKKKERDVEEPKDVMVKEEKQELHANSSDSSTNYEKFETYSKDIRNSINANKNLDTVTKIMTKSPFNLNDTVDKFYSSKTSYYSNEFKGDIFMMYNSVKNDIVGMIKTLDWSDTSFVITIDYNGESKKLNLLLMYVILRHMFCINLINNLITAAGSSLMNAKMLKYFQSCLQATLQLLFISDSPVALVDQQNVLFGELAGKLWENKSKDIIWGQSDYDTHEKLTDKINAVQKQQVKSGGQPDDDISAGVDVIHGNFVKIFMQKLSTAMIANIKEAQTAPIPKQNELLLHNNQIYTDMRNAIASFLFNVLFNYVTFDNTQTGGEKGVKDQQVAATNLSEEEKDEDEKFKLISALINKAKQQFDDKGFINAELRKHLDKEYKKFMIYSNHPKTFGFKTHTWPDKFMQDAKKVEVNYDALMQSVNELYESKSLTTVASSQNRDVSSAPNDMMVRLDKIPATTPPSIREMFNIMLFVDKTAWSPLLLPAKTGAKSMKVYLNTWAKHAIGKIKAVRKLLLSSKNRLIHDSLEFQNGDYDERQIQVVVYKPPEDSNHNPPHYDIRVINPELTATQFFNALSTKYPNYIGAPVPARLSPDDDENWQNIELGDPKKSPALKKTTADWVGPDMNSVLAIDAPPVPESISSELQEQMQPAGFIQDSTLLPGSSIASLFKNKEYNYFAIQSVVSNKPNIPSITSSLLNYLDSDFITPGLTASAL